MSFSTERITRETIVEQSVAILITQALAARGYTQDTGDETGWSFIESWPYGLVKLDTNLIAVGFNFDDGGKQFEIGSNMKERRYTMEFFVFGMSLEWAKALANALKFSIEVDQVIPLYDVTQAPPVLSGEWMELDTVHSRREPVPDPEPWQEFVFCITATVTDWYTPINT